MSKKFRSKLFRVAVEGATTDGREIQRSWIEDMAATYNRNTYGARLNCEHIKGLAPDSVFGSYGDVLSLEAKEVDIAGEKKLALFAQIEPTEALIALNKKGQKIYTSIEVQPNFAKTGKAYLVGLAVTDSPASLGTEALEFSAQKGTLANRKLHADNLFTAAEETELEFEEVDDSTGAFKELATRVKALFSKNQKQDTQFAELGEALGGLVEHAEQQLAVVEAIQDEQADLSTKVTDLESRIQELSDTLSKTPAPDQFKRPPVPGGNGQIKTAF